MSTAAIQASLDALGRQGTLFMSKAFNVFILADSETEIAVVQHDGTRELYTTHAAFTAATGLLTRRQVTPAAEHVEQWAAVQYHPGRTRLYGV